MPKRGHPVSSYSVAKRARKSSYRRKKMYRNVTRTKGGLQNTIRRTIMRMAEPKDKTYAHPHTELYHNAGSPASGRILGTAWELLGPNRMPSVGTGETERNGDQIFGKGISVKMLLGQKEDRMNVTYRIIVWKGTTDVKPANLNDLFHWDSQNILLDGTNQDRGKVIYQKFIKKTISPQLAPYHVLEPAPIYQRKELTFTHKFWIPYKKLIKFAGNSGTDYSGDKIYMFIYAFDAYGTAYTDNIAYVDVWSRFYYADP